MRILITGMNKGQCTERYFERQQLKVVLQTYSLTEAMRAYGHTVDVRPVKIGETLEEYDRVIVFLHNVRSFTCHVYNAAWALYCRPDAIISFDDWQIKEIYDSCVDNANDRLFDRYIYDQQEQIAGLTTIMRRFIIEGLSEVQNSRRTILLSAYSGGNTDLLFPGRRVYTYNPNPFHLHRKTTNVFPEDKQRVFNFASLVQGRTQRWLKNYEFPWPIEYYGSKKFGQPRLTEQEMCAVYARQWGCILPGYYHAGSGWWRARIKQIVDAGSIVVADELDARVYFGADNPVSQIRPEHLAELSTTELQEIAAAQHQALYNLHPLDRAQQILEIETALEGTK